MITTTQTTETPHACMRQHSVHRHRTGWRLVGVLFRSTLQTVQVVLFRCMFDVIFVTHKCDDNTFTDSLHTILVRWHTRPAVSTCCACLVKDMMMMYQPFPRIRYVRSYGLGLLLLCCREAAFSTYQIVHGLPIPSLSHPLFLECWCSRHEVALSASALGDQTWGFSGRYSVAEDA